VYLIPINPNRPLSSNVYSVDFEQHYSYQEQQDVYKEAVRDLLNNNLDILNPQDRAMALNDWHQAIMNNNNVPVASYTSKPATASTVVWWFSEVQDDIEFVLPADPYTYVDQLITSGESTNIDWKEFSIVLQKCFLGGSPPIIPVISHTSYEIKRSANTGQLAWTGNTGRYRGYRTAAQPSTSPIKDPIFLNTSHQNLIGTFIHEVLGHDMASGIGRNIINTNLLLFNEIWNILEPGNSNSPLSYGSLAYQLFAKNDTEFWLAPNGPNVPHSYLGTMNKITHVPPEASIKDLRSYAASGDIQAFNEEFIVRMLVHLMLQRGSTFTDDIRPIFMRAGISLSETFCRAVDNELRKVGLDNSRVSRSTSSHLIAQDAFSYNPGIATNTRQTSKHGVEVADHLTARLTLGNISDEDIRKEFVTWNIHDQDTA
jgi:hypothetical protein